MHTLTADKVSRPEASESVDLSVGSVRSPSHPETHTHVGALLYAQTVLYVFYLRSTLTYRVISLDYSTASNSINQKYTAISGLCVCTGRPYSTMLTVYTQSNTVYTFLNMYWYYRTR